MPTDSKTIRIVIDRPPVTLNPRRSIDANSQKLNELLYRGLTGYDENLNLKPSLSSEWKSEKSGTRWRFKIKDGLEDSLHQMIGTQELKQCFEEYRTGKPTAYQMDSFPKWIGTQAEGKEIIFHLSGPDPYFARNLSSLKYFRQKGRTPCSQPVENVPMGFSGSYRLLNSMDSEPGEVSEWILEPREEGLSPLLFKVVLDESVRILALFRGEADGFFNAISLSRTHWLKEKYKDRFQILERSGVAVSYLAFNLKDPVMKNPGLRLAIVQAIDRDEIVRYRMFGFGEKAASFLHPLVGKARIQEIEFNPKGSEKILEGLGYKLDSKGNRITLRFLCTNAREGYEQALIFKNQLKKIGVELKIEVVDPGIFLDAIDRGRYQMYSSRWIGVSDRSIFRTTLKSGAPRNRIGYADQEMDSLLDQLLYAKNESEELSIEKKIEDKMLKDLPYFPLWYWNNALVLVKNVKGLNAEELSLAGSLVPLGRLKK